MIASFIPGRIRLRFNELKNSVTAGIVKARIKEVPGIIKVEIHSLTGSILIEYDTKILPAAKLVETGRRELAKLGVKLDIPDFR